MAFKWAIASATALSILVGAGAPAWANLLEEQEEAVEELNRSEEVFQEIATDPDTQIPPALLEDSLAVIVITNMGQGGFIVGGRGGDGLMVLREEDGTWSNPAFVTLSGGSFGLQFGGRNSDLVLLVRTQETIQDILDGDIELGGSVTGTAGPVGATVTDPAAANGDILIYSRSEGLFGGVTAEGTTLEFDEERNEAFYGVENLTAYEIFTNPNLSPIVSVTDLKQTLLSQE